MTSYDDLKATEYNPNDELLDSNLPTSSEWFYARLAEKDKEIDKLRKLLRPAFTYGVETSCDFYDNGFPKKLADKAFAKWLEDNKLI